MTRPWRSRLLLVVFVLAPLALSAAACGGDGAPASGRPKLVVSMFGYAADRVEETVIKPFERQTGIDVVVETGANADRLSKLRINRNAPTVDVTLMSDFYAALGEHEGLFEKVDAAALPNLADVRPFARNPAGYGPAYTFALLGMIYRTDRVQGTPTPDQLISGRYKGQIAVPDMAITAGIPFLLALAEAYGSGPTDMEAAFRTLVRMKPDVLTFFSRSTELASLLDREEVVMAPALDLFAVDLVQRGQPIAWAPFPVGRYLVTNRAELVKGSPRRAEGQKFIDFLLSPAVQAQAAESFHDKPVNRTVKVPPVLAGLSGKAATDPVGAGFRPVDFTSVMSNYGTWVERFAREVAG